MHPGIVAAPKSGFLSQGWVCPTFFKVGNFCGCVVLKPALITDAECTCPDMTVPSKLNESTLTTGNECIVVGGRLIVIVDGPLNMYIVVHIHGVCT